MKFREEFGSDAQGLGPVQEGKVFTAALEALRHPKINSSVLSARKPRPFEFKL